VLPLARDETILSVSGLCKYLGGAHALENLDISVNKGQIHGSSDQYNTL
jgi:ABC-type branched-subunit amino acid transport system ATPase component